MTKLYNYTVKPLKFKEASKYPSIKKDVAFIVDNDVTNKMLEESIKKAGGRLLDSIDMILERFLMKKLWKYLIILLIKFVKA